MPVIDKAKVDELLREKQPNYLVTVSHLVISPPPKLNIPETVTYGGAYFPAIRSLIEAEKYMSSLRDKVIKSGISLKSAEELDREIDQMRRNR